MKPIRVYQCEDSVEGILSAVYDAGLSRYGHDYIRLEALSANISRDRDLFSEYIDVAADPRKRDKVMDSIAQKISVQVLEHVLRICTSSQEDKADVIYHYVVYGFAMGSRVSGAMQIPCVARALEIDRRIANEVYHFLGFLRFGEVQKNPSILLAGFAPENDILGQVTKHFADRFHREYFIIYDTGRKKATFHSRDGNWFMRELSDREARQLDEMSRVREEYEDLWKAFFDAIRIKERENPKLQQNNIPLRYREYMPEFMGSPSRPES